MFFKTTVPSWKPLASVRMATSKYYDIPLTPVKIMATPAKKLFMALAEETKIASNIRFKPDCVLEQLALSQGYKPFLFRYADEPQEEATFLLLHETEPTVVEVNTILSKPQGLGHGSSVMRALCHYADELGITLWLSCRPFPATRTSLCSKKALKKWYATFRFSKIKSIKESWINTVHLHSDERFECVMVRYPWGAK